MYGSNHPDLAFPKDRPKVLDKRQADRDRKRAERDVAKAVKARDKGLCRCCGKRGDHVHHLIYRSHGGASVLGNLVLLCAVCHQDIHAKLIQVDWRGKVPAAKVTFTRLGK